MIRWYTLKYKNWLDNVTNIWNFHFNFLPASGRKLVVVQPEGCLQSKRKRNLVQYHTHVFLLLFMITFMSQASQCLAFLKISKKTKPISQISCFVYFQWSVSYTMSRQMWLWLENYGASFESLWLKARSRVTPLDRGFKVGISNGYVYNFALMLVTQFKVLMIDFKVNESRETAFDFE